MAKDLTMDEGKRNENGSSGGMNLIDLALRQSSAELKKMVRYYKQIGRNDEAQKIDEALDRMERTEQNSLHSDGSQRQDH